MMIGVCNEDIPSSLIRSNDHAHKVGETGGSFPECGHTMGSLPIPKYRDIK